ncbi:hypothetical protein [Streptomyces sp. cmx-10-25]|uniref:hypothetical protein n=1 Tax=Streptomyces sp. cmx-10-25 TaxID=2790919 RepID=UPI00397F7703
MTEPEAHQVIGASVLAGFGINAYTRDAHGERMQTPKGELLTVVAVTGGTGQAVTAFAFTGRAR